MSDETAVIRASLDRFDERYGELRLVRPRAEAVLCESMGQLGQLMPLVATKREGALAVIDGFKVTSALTGVGVNAERLRPEAGVGE